MRFERKRRWGTFAWTPRKLAAAQSHGARVKARLEQWCSLLSDQFSQPQRFDADVEACIRAQAHQATEQRLRDFEARVWRESRRDARNATAEQQAAIREHWLAWRGPATALYYRYVVDLHTGALDERRELSQAQTWAAIAAVLATKGTQAVLFTAAPGSGERDGRQVA